VLPESLLPISITLSWLEKWFHDTVTRSAALVMSIARRAAGRGGRKYEGCALSGCAPSLNAQWSIHTCVEPTGTLLDPPNTEMRSYCEFQLPADPSVDPTAGSSRNASSNVMFRMMTLSTLFQAHWAPTILASSRRPRRSYWTGLACDAPLLRRGGSPSCVLERTARDLRPAPHGRVVRREVRLEGVTIALVVGARQRLVVVVDIRVDGAPRR